MLVEIMVGPTLMLSNNEVTSWGPLGAPETRSDATSLLKTVSQTSMKWLLSGNSGMTFVVSDPMKPLITPTQGQTQRKSVEREARIKVE